jgi:aminoglycoside phosphotransferase (APT) family kinase protein
MNDKFELPLDHGTAVRRGEELPLERLTSYLDSHLEDLGPLVAAEQFPSGFSNLTYLLRFQQRDLVLRRPPFGANVRSGHDMKREFEILSKLHPVFLKVPRPLLFCSDYSILDADFYVMERVRGTILRGQMRKPIRMQSEVLRRFSEALVDTLVDIHAIDPEKVDLATFGRPQGYVQRQIDGWIQRYRNAQTDEVGSVERVGAWLEGNVPVETSRSAIIHNDFKYDNVVFAPDDTGRVIAILDWEMATVGDPLMDLGTSLGYWIDRDDPAEWQSAGMVPTNLEGNLSRIEIIERYTEKSGNAVANPVFYYAYGLLKIAVIVQQIYSRYRKGHTKDPRFANLISMVELCGRMAERGIEKNRIYNLS